MTAANERMVAAEIFGGPLGIPFVRLEERAIHVEREARTATHRLEQR
jgi:hypothetical protein